MSESKSNIANYATVGMLLVLILGPSIIGSCSRGIGGLEFTLPFIGKIIARPTPPEPAIVPPETRCLIFTASWCKPCAQLRRNVAVMSRNGWRVGSLDTDDIEFIDVDGPDPRLAKYKRSSVPTLVIVDRSGKEIARREGVQTSDALGEWIRSTRTHAAPAGQHEQPIPMPSAWRGTLQPSALRSRNDSNSLSECCAVAEDTASPVAASAVDQLVGRGLIAKLPGRTF